MELTLGDYNGFLKCGCGVVGGEVVGLYGDEIAGW
jgi:hypothetical protein